MQPDSLTAPYTANRRFTNHSTEIPLVKSQVGGKLSKRGWCRNASRGEGSRGHDALQCILIMSTSTEETSMGRNCQCCSTRCRPGSPLGNRRWMPGSKMEQRMSCLLASTMVLTLFVSMAAGSPENPGPPLSPSLSVSGLLEFNLTWSPPISGLPSEGYEVIVIDTRAVLVTYRVRLGSLVSQFTLGASTAGANTHSNPFSTRVSACHAACGIHADLIFLTNAS